jgi:uncharacterized protein (DUF58 family)
LNAPLRRVGELARKRGLIVLISDLLAPLQELEQNLGRLAAAGHEMVIFQVLDPNELTFDFAHPVLLQEMESGRELFINPAAARGEYRRKFQAHQSDVQAISRKLGIACHTLLTTQPLELALLEFLRSRSRRGKRVHRRNQARA